MSKQFRSSPLAVAVALALGGNLSGAVAADVEIKAPPGGSVVVRDASGALLLLSATVRAMCAFRGCRRAPR